MEAAARFIEELLGLSSNGSSDSARDAECNDDAKEDKCDNVDESECNKSPMN
ncbi:hypothetical protein LPJ73_007746, partial [Coemansia sp. RSA 2703]